MPLSKGFDNDFYLKKQKEAISERVRRFENKLYIEFGGKLVYDYHAARVLPGYDPNAKMRLLKEFDDQAEVIICIFADDIEKRKIRADFGITYDENVLKLIDDLNDWGISICAVVITRFNGQHGAVYFKNRLERQGIRVYTHGATRGYPTDVETIVSDEGYGSNAFIETTKPIVVVTGPGPGSGKLATCLSQIYHEHRRGIHAGYSKFETFPVWNLPLKHPVNMAYEAATADLGDVNLIDHFHLEAYNLKTVNYNRDLDAFPLLKRILDKITHTPDLYSSPTDMGFNMVGFGITDDEAVREASIQEVLRRYFRYSCEYMLGTTEKEAVHRVELIMDDLGVKPEDRGVVLPAREAAKEARENGKGFEGAYCGAAIELPGGEIVTGKNSPLFHSSSSLILNAAKKLAEIPDRIHLLPQNIIKSLNHFKKHVLHGNKLSLDLEETLITLCISATTNPAAAEAVERLKELKGCEVHLSHMPTPGDEAGLRKLGLNVTSEPAFSSKCLFDD
ncbi:MAG: DUF1846 domain-containing protein [Synergistales bacterium]|nr:DUF1846 domain-containing protein [Synergistales bacterium]